MQFDRYIIKVGDDKFVFKGESFVNIPQNARRFNSVQSAARYAKKHKYTDFEITKLIGKEQYSHEYEY